MRAPDLLAAVGLLGALALVPGLAERPTAWRWLAACGLYLGAQLSKEVVVVFPVLAALVLATTWRTDEPLREGLSGKGTVLPYFPETGPRKVFFLYR